MTALLSARGLAKRFAGVQALDGVSLDVEAGECVGLVGPNGAGKSTLFDCLSGRQAPDAGQVTFRGRPLGRLSPVERARLGMARTFQRVELFSGLTVGDHLTVAAQSRRGRPRLWRDLAGRGRPTPADRQRAAEVADLLGLGADLGRPVEALSLGRARLVELGRALACDPVLLFLDEPSSGLDRHEAAAMAAVIEGVRRRSGVAVVLVEHDVPLVRRLAGRLYVLDAGRLVADGPTGPVLDGAAARAAYLGPGPGAGAGAGARDGPRDEPPAPAGPAGGAAGGPPVLELDGVTAGYGPFRALSGVSLAVPADGAVALVGPNGAGKTTVARVVTGLLAPTRGRVRLDGQDVTGRPAHALARRGVGHANEGRSVFASLSVEDNLALAFRAAFGRAGVAAALGEAYALFPVLGDRRRQVGGSLSGGEQRMLTLARALVVRPAVLVADEPSLGLAPVAVEAAYDLLRRVRERGTAVLVVEQRLDRVLALADRVVALEGGEVTWQGPSAEFGDRAAAFLSATQPAGDP